MATESLDGGLLGHGSGDFPHLLRPRALELGGWEGGGTTTGPWRQGSFCRGSGNAGQEVLKLDSLCGEATPCRECLREEEEWRKVAARECSICAVPVLSLRCGRHAGVTLSGWACGSAEWALGWASSSLRRGDRSSFPRSVPGFIRQRRGTRDISHRSHDPEHC